MFSYEGYGLNTSNLSLTDDAYEKLYSMIKHSGSSLCEDITGYYEENKYDELYSSEESSFRDFCENWYENNATGLGGIEQVISDFINEQEFGGNRRLVYEDCVYHVPAGIPADEEAKKTFPTTHQIDALVQKYIAPLYKQTAEIGWYTIHLD